jgi:mono/diheme cytochrome c family protein
LIWLKAGAEPRRETGDASAPLRGVIAEGEGMRRTAIRGFAGVLALAAPLVAAGAVSAAERIVDGEGQHLAGQWCAECHEIRAGRHTSPNPDAPPFADLVDDPAVTETGLRALLRKPHATMPNIRFTREQMEDIVDYLLSLKREK